MEFYHLRSFVAVAQTGNLTQAAKRLYTTPPAISAHIKTLEEELATPLFVRSSKGMSLTAKGQLLLQKAQLTLDTAVDLVNLAADNQHEIMGTFHLGINQPAKNLRLATLAEKILEDSPGICLDIHPKSTGNIIEEIRNQTLDGGYIYGEVPEDFIGFPVMEQQMTTIAPIDLAIDSTLTITQLRKLQWIKMGDYCPFDGFLNKKLGNNIPSVIKSHNDGTRLELVRSGLGLSFFELEDAVIAEKEHSVTIIPSLDFTATLQFVISQKREKEPVISAFTNQIKSLWS